MKSLFLASFARSRKVPDAAILEQIRSAIVHVEEAADLRAIHHLKKLSGSGSYFRIRVGDYRIGLRVEGDTVTSCASCRDATSTGSFRDPAGLTIACRETRVRHILTPPLLLSGPWSPEAQGR